MTCIRALQAPPPPPSPFSLAFEAFSWSACGGFREILRRPWRHLRVLALHSRGRVLRTSRGLPCKGDMLHRGRGMQTASVFLPEASICGSRFLRLPRDVGLMLADSRAVSVAAVSLTSLAYSRFGKEVERSRCPRQGYGVWLASQPRTSGTGCESGSVIKERVMRKRTTSIIISLPSP